MPGSAHASDCLQIVQWILVGSLVPPNLTLFDLPAMPVLRLINYLAMCNNRTHDVVRKGPPWAETGLRHGTAYCCCSTYAGASPSTF
ncbi:hypothetical protein FOPG_00174 [Fusarium oxysporum f. sp. conglutinans race 2 54008]|uniref:Uncharacterized protein n=1 Tax=Fusarium oxysporum f. sp. conglutinans race 2 54008 TaxID=1089457 RepID=X0IKT0_FUSOX|nr:hypothetical protein FOPG_00174 [Fusarium oxysporum f. sp. conglutinans race 2 54008]